MIITSKEYEVKNIRYKIRSAEETDAKRLSEIRLQIDGETENLDREPGEAFLDEASFKGLIHADAMSARNLFLVAEVDGSVVGFSRCEGNSLKRTCHQVEFGIAVLKEYWGCGMGQNLLKESIEWADANGILKISLKVLETNEKAILLYKKYGFEIEGILRKDKYLSDGKYYDTVVMGRIQF